MKNPVPLLSRATDSFIELFSLFAGVLGVSTILYSIFEHKNLWDSFWWAVVTSMTVGYGDTYPSTPAGRLIGIGLMMTTVLFVIPLITAQIASKLIVDSNAFTADEQDELKENVRKILKKVNNEKS